MVSATRPQGGSAARSAARRRNDTAMERRGAHVSSDEGTAHRKVRNDNGRLAALHPLGVSEGNGRGGRPPRAFKNRGDSARLGADFSQ